MALGILVIMYIVLCIISIVGLLALFLTKNMAARKQHTFAALLASASVIGGMLVFLLM